MADIGTLSAKLALNPNPFTKALDVASSKAASFAADTGSKLDAFAQTASAALAKVDGTTAADKIKEFFTGIGDGWKKVWSNLANPLPYIGEKLKAIPKVGAFLALPVEGLAALKGTFDEGSKKILDMSKAADRLGVSLDDFQRVSVLVGGNESAQGMLAKLQKAIIEASMGSVELAGQFRNLGLDADDLAAIPLGDAFKKVAQGIKEQGNAAIGTSAALGILGRNSIDSLDKIRKGAKGLDEAGDKIRDFGLGFSAIDVATIKAAGAAKKNMELMKEGFTNQITLAIAPILEELSFRISAVTGSMNLLGNKAKDLAGIGRAKIEPPPPVTTGPPIDIGKAAVVGGAALDEQFGKTDGLDQTIAKTTLLQDIVTGTGKVIGYSGALIAEQWNAAGVVWDSFTASMKALGATALVATEIVIDAFQGVIDYLTPAWETISAGAAMAWAVVSESASAAWANVTKVATVAWDGIYAVFGPVIDGMVAGFTKVYEWAKVAFGYIEKAARAIGRWVGGAAADLSAEADKAFAAEPVGEGFRAKLAAMRKGLVGGTLTDFENMKAGAGRIGDAFGGVDDFFTKVEGRSRKTADVVAKDAGKAAADAMDALSKIKLDKLAIDTKGPFGGFMEKAEALVKLGDTRLGKLGDAPDNIALMLGKDFADLAGKIKLPEDKSAGALLEGSKEAYSAIAAFRRGDKPTTIQEQVLALQKEAKAQRDREIQIGKEVRDAILAIKKKGV